MKILNITFVTFIRMRIEDKDVNGEGYLVIESKEDLDEFRKMLIEACQEIRCKT
jgi:hypothetical protein